MSDVVNDYLTFYYVGLGLFLLLGLVFVVKCAQQSGKTQKNCKPEFNFTCLNGFYEQDVKKINQAVKQGVKCQDSKKFIAKFFKQSTNSKKVKKDKSERKVLKKISKKAKKGTLTLTDIGVKRIFVIDFNSDKITKDLANFRHAISIVLQVADPQIDEVIVKITSPGGAVWQYGLASSQLARLRKRGIKVTACVDAIAASGGYMLAVVANKIIAAPFALVGSIGVVATIPNFNRALTDKGVDYYQFTAGKYKRTVDMFTKPTKEGQRKLTADLEDIHTKFKQHIHEYRPGVDLDKVANGDYWLASQAHELQLVDELATSDDIIADLVVNGWTVISLDAKPRKEGLAKYLPKLIAKLQESIYNGQQRDLEPKVRI